MNRIEQYLTMLVVAVGCIHLIAEPTNIYGAPSKDGVWRAISSGTKKAATETIVTETATRAVTQTAQTSVETASNVMNVTKETLSTIVQEKAPELLEKAAKSKNSEISVAALKAAWTALRENASQTIRNICIGVPTKAMQLLNKLAEEPKKITDTLMESPTVCLALTAGTAYLLYKRYQSVRNQKAQALKSLATARDERFLYEALEHSQGVLLPVLALPTDRQGKQIEGHLTPAKVLRDLNGRRDDFTDATELATQYYQRLIDKEGSAGNQLKYYTGIFGLVRPYFNL
jgi:hypothetical protein